MKEKLVKVRLGKTDYKLPYVSEAGRKLVRITSHPLNPGKLLVWRTRAYAVPQEGAGQEYRHLLFAIEAHKAGASIEEEGAIADIIYQRSRRKAYVWDFVVEPRFRMESLGSALRETMMQDLKRQGVKEITFPPHKEEDFYTKRGIEKTRQGYRGKLKELGVKPGGIRLKVLWQRSRPRFAK